MYDAEAGDPANISAQEEVMVRCILIRAAYGGMAGDVAMLKAFAATWKLRSAASWLADKTARHALCHSRYCISCYVLVPVHVTLQHHARVMHMCLLSDSILCTTGCVVFVDSSRVMLVPMHCHQEIMRLQKPMKTSS